MPSVQFSWGKQKSFIATRQYLEDIERKATPGTAEEILGKSIEATSEFCHFLEHPNGRSVLPENLIASEERGFFRVEFTGINGTWILFQIVKAKIILWRLLGNEDFEK